MKMIILLISSIEVFASAGTTAYEDGYRLGPILGGIFLLILIIASLKK